MAISVLDVRVDTFAPAHVRVPARPDVATEPATSPRRLPLAVLAVGVLSVVEALALLAGALTGLDGVLGSPTRPAGVVLIVGLLLLAAWIVLCAGSGAVLIDGAGRGLVLGVSFGELALIAAVTVLATAMPLFPASLALPLPVLVLLALAVPVGKLLLVGSPSAVAWVATGPRTRERRPDPAAAHRLLCTLTMAVIGVSLGALALLTPVQGHGANAPAADVVSQP